MTARIRTLIVDDEPAARAAIRTLLAPDHDILVIAECAEGGAALETIRADAPDLVYLDVQMPGMDGFALLQQLNPAEMPVIVFVTAYDRYALRAFEAHALDYLLKPFSNERFQETLTRAKQQVRQGKLGALHQQLLTLLDAGARATPPPAEGAYLKRLVIKSGSRVTILGVKDIDWIEADGDYVRVHSGRAWHVLRETMKRLETQFDPGRFVRIHRSTIVNVERIKELQPYFHGEYVVVLQDGTHLKLSRGYKEHLETALGRPF
jgi:two-component system LytT family response regulator